MFRVFASGAKRPPPRGVPAITRNDAVVFDGGV
jgi:hypothetical protein